MLQIWLEPGLVHLKQSWPQALPTEKQPSTAVVPPKVGSDVPFFVTDDHCSILHRLLPSNMVLALSCNIKGCLLIFFVSQSFLISVWFVAKSGSLPTKTRKITACNASLSGNQSAQPPPRGYSSEGDSGGTLSEGQQMRFCCWGKLFQNFTTRVTLVAWIVAIGLRRGNKRGLRAWTSRSLGQRIHKWEGNSKKHGSYGIGTQSCVSWARSQKTVLPKENPLPSICFVSPLLHKPWNSLDNSEMENRHGQT